MFATTSFKKGGGHIFMGGLIFGRLRYCSQYLRRDCTMHSNRLFLQFIQWWLEDDDSKIEWEVDEDGSGMYVIAIWYNYSYGHVKYPTLSSK